MKYTCDICGKQFDNKQAFCGHRGHHNRKTPYPGWGWNKGLTKETDERVRKNSEKVSKSLVGRKGTKLSEEHKKKISVHQSLHNNGGRCKWYKVSGQKVQGTWERDLAKLFVKYKIDWEKIKTNNKVFRYTFKDKERSYAPDFYIKEFDIYLEVKGFWWGDDKKKMNHVIDQVIELKNKIRIIEKDQYNRLINSKTKEQFIANLV